MLQRRRWAKFLAVVLAVTATDALGQDSSQPPPTVSYKDTVREQMEQDGIVVMTPRIVVAGRDTEAVQKIAELTEEAIAALPSDLELSTNLWVHVLPGKTDRCPIRGQANRVEGQPLIEIYLRSEWSEATLRRIVHHEVGHIYHRSLLAGSLEEARRPTGDMIMSEGLATWLTRTTWLADLGFPSLQGAVRSYVAAGKHLGLVENYEADVAEMTTSTSECLELRDAIYTQYAAFVGFLIDEFGFDAVLAASAQERLIRSEETGYLVLAPLDNDAVLAAFAQNLLIKLEGSDKLALAPLDYEAAFGAPLGELEKRWLDLTLK